MTEEKTEIRCGICDGQASQSCEPFDDPRSHDFQGWLEFDDGRGGTTKKNGCFDPAAPGCECRGAAANG